MASYDTILAVRYFSGVSLTQNGYSEVEIGEAFLFSSQGFTEFSRGFTPRFLVFFT